jgi:translocator protein
MNTYTWYTKLKKPSWAPPKWLFGPVWTFLYILIIISFGKVVIMAFGNELPLLVVLPFVLNLFFNFIFTPIQFGMKNNFLAAVDITLIWLTIVWSMMAIFPFAAWITYMQVPYLIWVSIATVLQFTITYLNRKESPRYNR